MPHIRNSNIGYASFVDVDAVAYSTCYSSSDSINSTCASPDAPSTPSNNGMANFNAMPTPSPSPMSKSIHRLARPSPPKFEQFLPLDSSLDGAKQQQGERQGQGQYKRKHIAMTSPSHPRTNPDHIPRPRNAFILFRSHVLSQLSAQSQFHSHFTSAAIHRSGGRGKRTKEEYPIQIPVQQQEASREIAKLWRNVDAKTRAEFQERAREEKRRHKQLYPYYRYAPRKVQQRQHQSEAQAKAARAPAPGRVKSVKTKDDDGFDGNAPYVPGGPTKVHARAQERKAPKRRVAAPLTPDTTPSPHLPQVDPVDFEEECDADAVLEYPVPEEEEKHNASALFGGIFQSTATPETNLYELPHPEFCFPPNFDANNKNNYWEGTSGRVSDAPVIDESRVPLLASSFYYTPTFTHVDRTRSDSDSSGVSLGPGANPHMKKCTDAPCPSHFHAQIQQMADFDTLLSFVTANKNGSSSPFTFATLTNNKKEGEDEERDLIRRALRPFAPLWAFEERKRSQGSGSLDGAFALPFEMGGSKAVADTAGVRERLDLGAETEMDLDLDATLAELVHLDMLTI